MCDDIPVTGLLTPDLLVMESLYQDLLDSKSRAFQIHLGLLFGDQLEHDLHCDTGPCSGTPPLYPLPTGGRSLLNWTPVIQLLKH